jgi:TRAP-type C4-dicarboxylate transport system substrate-binding protein
MQASTPLLRRSLLGLASLVAFCASAQAQTTVLKMSNWVPPTHAYTTEVLTPWAAQIEKATAGRVKIEILPKVVGTPGTQYEVVRDGMADVVTVVPGYSPGRFDVFGLGELPMASSDPKVGAPAYQNFYDKHLAKLNLFKGAHVLSAFTTSPGHVFTSKKPVTKMADFSGLKLRSPVTTTVESLKAVNAVPMQKPSTELYELISGGVLDGTLAGPDQVFGMRLGELTKNLTLIPGGFYSSVMVVMINEDAWKKISDADRKSIDALSGKAFAERIGVVFSKSVADGIAEFKAKGGTVVEADPAMLAEMRKAFEPMEKAMYEKARRAGLANPEAALAELKADIAKGEKAVK